MFHGVIKSRGRVPSSDGFVARRIAGPGLASNYFYQVQVNQASQELVFIIIIILETSVTYTNQVTVYIIMFIIRYGI